jgi:hypothetical protein
VTARRTFLAALVLCAVVLPAQAAEFDRVVRAVAAESGLKRQYIPFLGIGRLFVRMQQPEGVHDFRIAVFGKTGAVSFSPELIGSVERTFGAGWSPLVSSRSNRSGEQALIFARPVGNLMRLVIIANDDEEVAVIQVDLDPEKVAMFAEDESAARGVQRPPAVR